MKIKVAAAAQGELCLGKVELLFAHLDLLITKMKSLESFCKTLLLLVN